jgi:mono/diheme cytochrome c family protein
MRGGPARHRSWKPPGTAVLLAAVLVASFPAPAQEQRLGRTTEGELVDSGRQQYHRICAHCHGFNMVNSGNTVYDLRRFPQDQPERFYRSVTKGKGNMPSFGDALTQEQIDLLWAYVRHRGKTPK